MLTSYPGNANGRAATPAYSGERAIDGRRESSGPDEGALTDNRLEQSGKVDHRDADRCVCATIRHNEPLAMHEDPHE
jgi:hypothetical protein